MANDQEARVELTADTRSFKQKLDSAKKSWAGFGESVRKEHAKTTKSLGMRRAGGKLGAGLASIGGLGLKALAGGAVGGAGLVAGLVAGQARSMVNFEEDLTRLQIASRGALGSMDSFRQKVLQVSDATGVAREEVLRGASAYMALTGDAKASVASLELFSKIQRATGSSMDDIAASSAALAQNLKIDPSQFEKAFSILIAGGKAGSVELKDMASLLAGLAPLAERFEGGSGTSGLANLGAALQLARQGFGSANEAATGLDALMGAIVQHADKLESAGVAVFKKDASGKKELREFQEIVEAIGNSKLAKDPTLLIKALGRKEALAAYLQLVKVDGAWDDLADATMAANDVAEDYAAFQESAAGKLQAVWNEVRNQLAQTFTPERIRAFADAMGEVVRAGTAAKDILVDVGKAIGVVDLSADERRDVEDRTLAVHEDASDEDLENLSRLNFPGQVNLAAEALRIRRARRRATEDAGERQRRAMEAVGGAPAFGMSQYKPEFDVAAEASEQDRARAAGGALSPTGAVLFGKREVRVRVEPVKVKVSAGPGLRAEVDNDPRQRVSP